MKPEIDTPLHTGHYWHIKSLGNKRLGESWGWVHLYRLTLLIQPSKKKLLLKIDMTDFRIQKLTGVILRDHASRAMIPGKHNGLREMSTRLAPQGNKDLGADNCGDLAIPCERRGLGDWPNEYRRVGWTVWNHCSCIFQSPCTLRAAMLKAPLLPSRLDSN